MVRYEEFQEISESIGTVNRVLLNCKKQDCKSSFVRHENIISNVLIELYLITKGGIWKFIKKTALIKHKSILME